MFDSIEDYVVDLPKDAIPCPAFVDDLKKYGPLRWVIKEERFVEHCAARGIRCDLPLEFSVARTEHIVQAFAECGLDYICPVSTMVNGQPGPWLSFTPPLPDRLAFSTTGIGRHLPSAPEVISRNVVIEKLLAENKALKAQLEWTTR